MLEASPPGINIETPLDLEFEYRRLLIKSPTELFFDQSPWMAGDGRWKFDDNDLNKYFARKITMSRYDKPPTPEEIWELTGNTKPIEVVDDSGASTTGLPLKLSQARLLLPIIRELGKSNFDIKSILEIRTQFQMQIDLELKGLSHENCSIDASNGTDLEIIATKLAITKAQKLATDPINPVSVLVLTPTPNEVGTHGAHCAMGFEKTENVISPGATNTIDGINIIYDNVPSTDDDIVNKIVAGVLAGQVVRTSLVTATKNGGSIGSEDVISRVYGELKMRGITNIDDRIVFEIDNCQGRLPTKLFQKWIDTGHIVIDSGSKAFGQPMYHATGYLNKAVASQIDHLITDKKTKLTGIFALNGFSDTLIGRDPQADIVSYLKRELDINAHQKFNQACEYYKQVTNKDFFPHGLINITKLISNSIQSLDNELAASQGNRLHQLVPPTENAWIPSEWKNQIPPQDVKYLNSIFTIAVMPMRENRWLTKAELAKFNQHLGQIDGVKINLGQPIPLQQSNGETIYGLRLGLNWLNIADTILESQRTQSKMLPSNLKYGQSILHDRLLRNSIYIFQQMIETNHQTGDFLYNTEPSPAN